MASRYSRLIVSLNSEWIRRVSLRCLVMTFGVLVSMPLNAQPASPVTKYTVLPGDTFARIARANDLSLSELQNANPGVLSELRPGDQLAIPAPRELTNVRDGAIWTTGVPSRHEVMPGETLYGISKQYGISLDDLKELNPSASRGLDVGTQLVISASSSSQDPEVSAAFAQRRLQILMEAGVLVDSTALNQPPWIETDTLHVLAMLPFLLEVDTVLGGDFDTKTNRLREIALDFMHGTLWAAESLKALGFHVVVRASDTEPDSLGNHSWTEDDLMWADVVLGPLRKAPLDSINRLLAQSDIPQWVLTPQNESTWHAHPKAYSLESDPLAGMKKMGAWVSAYHKTDPIIILETRGKDADLEQAFIQGFQSNRGSLEGLEFLPANSRFAEGLTARMDTSKLNVVVIPSGKPSQSMYAYVQTELQLADSFPIQLYAHPASLDFDFLELDFLTRSLWTMPVANEVDWNRPNVQAEVSLFRTLYSTDPNLYAIAAHDAVIESARWMRKEPVLPSQLKYATEWGWDETAGRLVNQKWELWRLGSTGWMAVD